MSNYSANETPTTMTPEEIRAHLQSELEAGKQAIEALSDEELESITGGSLSNRIHNAGAIAKGMYQGGRDLGYGKVTSAYVAARASVQLGLSNGSERLSSQEVRQALQPQKPDLMGLGPGGTVSAAPRH